MRLLNSAIRTAPHVGMRKKLLHVFPSFGIGGVPLRMARVLNHLGAQFSHTIVSLDDNFEAAAHLATELDVTLLSAPLKKAGAVRATIADALMLSRLRPDLLLTYNWGSMEWAIANRVLQIAPHIHFEAGFGKEEADRQIRRRILCRRWTLAANSRIVVPSLRLEQLARKVWKLPAASVTYLPNGVDTARFQSGKSDFNPGFVRRPDELVIGTVAPLRPEKNIGRLLRAFEMLNRDLRAKLVVAGDGAERGALEQLADELKIADRILFTGQVKPEAVLSNFDVFALSSDTEQMPNAVLEAMAAGCAIAGVDVGDIKGMVSDGNKKYIVPRDDQRAFVSAITALLENDAVRKSLGSDNRHRAATEFSQERMFAGYSKLFIEALPTSLA